jgi:hypothetical protein
VKNVWRTGNETSPQQATGYQNEQDAERSRSKLRGIAPCKGLKNIVNAFARAVQEQTEALLSTRTENFVPSPPSGRGRKCAEIYVQILSTDVYSGGNQSSRGNQSICARRGHHSFLEVLSTGGCLQYNTRNLMGMRAGPIPESHNPQLNFMRSAHVLRVVPRGSRAKAERVYQPCVVL